MFLILVLLQGHYVIACRYVCSYFLSCRGYCAPEYLKEGKSSSKSDIYSLGVMITELVTGTKNEPDHSKVRGIMSTLHMFSSHHDANI
jgi:serine/threonine protein kinase